MSDYVQITCPECGFSRAVDPKRLPGKSVIATCPKCSCRFRFSADGGNGEILSAKQKSQSARELDNNEAVNNVGQNDNEPQGSEADCAERKNTVGKTSQRRNTSSPWQDAPGEDGWFSAFFQTSLRAMFAAPAFFAGLNPHSPKLRALSFYLIIGIFQTVVEKIWIHALRAVLEPAIVGDPQMEKMLTMIASDSNMVLSLILRCGILVAQIYFLSFLMFSIYRLLRPQAATFSLIFQVMAYSSAPSLLCVVPILGSVAGFVWGIVCMAVGMKAALNLSWSRTLLGFLPLLLFLAPAFMQLFAAV